MIRTKIIVAFPGCGKTTYYNKHSNCTLDISIKSFMDDDKKLNTDKFINFIKDNIGKYEVILMSSHKIFIDLLLDDCIFFYLVYPTHDRKNEFIERYKNRNNNSDFINFMDQNWGELMKSWWFIESGCTKINMVLPNLEDEINHLYRISTSGDSLS